MQTFIRYLIEKRSNPDKNVKQQAINQLFKYSNNAENLYASYTAINKLGINPQSAKKYNTPIGIYTYHLSYMLKRMNYTKQLDDVPYMGDQPNLWIVKPTRPVLVLQQYTAENLQTDKEKLKKAFAQKYENIDSNMNTWAKQARIHSHSGIMWNITRMLADKNPHKWNDILRNVLGYNIIRDDGGSIIHGNEPYQCVFLSINSLQIVEKIDKTIGIGDPKHSEFERNRSEQLVNAVTGVKQTCQMFLRSKTREAFDEFVEQLDGAVENFAKFKIEVALGAKTFKQLKHVLLSFNDPYYILNIASMIDVKEFDDVISADPELILKMVRIIKNNYEPGEKTIAKSQEYSIKYIDLLSKIQGKDAIFNLSYKSSQEFKQIITNVLNDEQQLKEKIAKYGVDTIYSKFHHLDVPNIKRIHRDDSKIDEEKELVRTFRAEGDEESLNDLCEYYGNVRKISDDNWNRVLDSIINYVYEDEGLWTGLKQLLTIFPDKPIDVEMRIRLIKNCIEYYYSHKQVKKRIFDELCHRSEISGDLPLIMDRILKPIDEPDELRISVDVFNDYLENQYSGDNTDEISSIIHKYKNKIAQLNVASGSF